MGILCWCVPQSWMLWEMSSSWMMTAPTWMRLHQLLPSQRACLETSRPTGYFTVSGLLFDSNYLFTAIINYWGFSLMATLLLVFSGWCSGWRVRPSSDSCYIKERSKHSLKFYMYHSLFSIYPTDTPSLRVRIFIIRAAMINRFISLKIISNYLDDQLILSVSFFK